ncbi:MAG: DUF4838 domain-containing protein [Ruminococcaceae bacterium]|nr:DUF4838 domain-containing protein [Oscillospiraceae bacterium]
MFGKIKPVVAGLTAKETKTVIFAAEELSRYLGMVDCAGDYPVIPTQAFTKKEENTLFLMVGHESLPQVEDSELDDAIFIDAEGVYGVIAGTNARSVLIAAYRFLRENGYAFIKPGKAGETLPEALTVRTVSVTEKASFRHRGNCIEGAVYQENLLDMIDWMPKVALNSYFIQFMEPDTFFQRHYNRIEKRITTDEIAAMNMLVKEEIKKRSILYHAVGHGWTCETMGIDSNTWDKYQGAVTEEQKELLAEIDGKRDLFNGQPLNTNLCYSNPLVQEKMTDAILDYCKAHPEVDYLHFWLADGARNVCECETCKKSRLSDQYIQMLNLLDEKLAKNNLNTRVVFLIYSSLLWAPLSEGLKNSKRFVLMWAPYNRTYARPLDVNYTPSHLPYPTNKDTNVIGSEELLTFLDDWYKRIQGLDAFNYDYHFILGCMYELTGYGLALTMHEDLKVLKDFGLNGIVSCQIQRYFLPTAIGMNVMAENLWDNTVSFDTIAEKTFRAQFGEDYQAVWDYMKALYDNSVSEAVRQMHDVGLVKNPDDVRSAANTEKMKNAVLLVDAFRARYGDKEKTAASENMRRNWAALFFGTEIIKLRNLYYLTGNKEEAAEIRKYIFRLADEMEGTFKAEFDRPFLTIPEI